MASPALCSAARMAHDLLNLSPAMCGAGHLSALEAEALELSDTCDAAAAQLLSTEITRPASMSRAEQHRLARECPLMCTLQLAQNSVPVSHARSLLSVGITRATVGVSVLAGSNIALARSCTCLHMCAPQKA